MIGGVCHVQYQTKALFKWDWIYSQCKNVSANSNRAQG